MISQKHLAQWQYEFEGGSKEAVLDALNAQALPAIVEELVAQTIVLDSSKWAEYGYRPSWLIKSPASLFYEKYKANLQEEKDYLLKSRPTGEVWPVPFSWYEHNDVYPKPSAIAGNWWLGEKALGNMRFLKKFGWIE